MIRFFHRRRKWLFSLAATTIIFGLMLSWLVGGELCAPANHPVPLPKDLMVEQVFSQRQRRNDSWLAGQFRYQSWRGDFATWDSCRQINAH
jgi:hypothetical protein